MRDKGDKYYNELKTSVEIRNTERLTFLFYREWCEMDRKGRNLYKKSLLYFFTQKFNDRYLGNVACCMVEDRGLEDLGYYRGLPAFHKEFIL